MSGSKGFVTGTLTGPDGHSMMLIEASVEALQIKAAEFEGLTRFLRPVEDGSATESEASRDVPAGVVQAMVNRMEALVQGRDALAVISQVLRRGGVLGGAGSSESTGTVESGPAVVEVITLVLLGLNLPAENGADEVPADVVDELINCAATVVRRTILQTWMGIRSRFAGVQVLAQRLAVAEVMVRGRQYEVVAARINEAILTTPQAEQALRSTLGFTYPDVVATRDALSEVAAREVKQILAVTTQAMQSGEPPTDDVLEGLRQLLHGHPERQLATIDQVSALAQRDQNIVGRILDLFSVAPDGRTPVQYIQNYLTGDNPLSAVAMLQVPGRGYLPLPGAMALEDIRRVCEPRLKDKSTKMWTKYDRARASATETLALESISGLLGGQAAVHPGVKYRYSTTGQDLSETSTTHAESESAEADGLVVVDGIAVCVEVKAGAFRGTARRGRTDHLSGDLDKTVKAAADQAERLRHLIQKHHGLWLENGNWLDLTEVREVRTMVVCLEDLGPLALSTAELVQTGILNQPDLPWVVSLADLLVIADVLDRPEHFFTYLRRRTHRSSAQQVFGADELDLLMWFVGGGYFIEPDPAAKLTPTSSAQGPESDAAEPYRIQVGTLTDPLNAFYENAQPVPCPRRAVPPPPLNHILTTMQREPVSGWLRLAADLDSCALDVQEHLGRQIDHLIEDSRPRLITRIGHNNAGRWAVVCAANCTGERDTRYVQAYTAAIKHHYNAERAYALAFHPTGGLAYTFLLDEPPREDPELDQLVQAMGLVPSP